MKTWFPIVGAPSIWFLQTVALWLITSWGCPGAEDWVRTWSWIVTVVSLLAVIASLYFVWSGWQHTKDNGMPRMSGWTQPAFSLAAALLVSGSAVVAIIAAAAPSAIIPACQGFR